MGFTVRVIAASVLCMTVVLAGGLVTACTGAPSATVPTPTGRSIDAPPPPSSTAASTAVATRTAALLPDPRPRLSDETVSEDLRRSTAVLDVEGTGRRPLSITRMPAGATHLVFAWVCAGGGHWTSSTPRGRHESWPTVRGAKRPPSGSVPTSPLKAPERHDGGSTPGPEPGTASMSGPTESPSTPRQEATLGAEV